MMEIHMRKRSDLGHAAILFVIVIFAAAFCVAAFGCGTVTLRYNSSGKETAKD